MKISKLFHWLYAVLMFLPIVMFLPSCLYYSLNKYATNETTTTINYKYQSNEVNTLDNLVEGNIYRLNNLTFTVDSELGSNFDFNTLYFDELSANGSPVFDEFQIIEYKTNYLSFYYSGTNLSLTVNFDINADDSYLYFDSLPMNLRLTNVVFIYNRFQFSYFNEYGYLPQYTNYNVIESVETNVQDTISNKMYLAWESIWNLPLFAWTKNSFVSAPFTYITGLFGLSATNSLNYVFTYFVSISICWLVFDLIMYVPNLAHKLIDKGAIE